MAASVMMSREGQQPVFHDFLGMTCTDSAVLPAANKSVAGSAQGDLSAGGASSAAGQPLVRTSSHLVSERQRGSNLDEVQLHGQMSSSMLLDRYSGRKRSNLDSGFMGSMRGRMLQMGSDSMENTNLMKIYQNEARDHRVVGRHQEEVLNLMQPPRSGSANPALLQLQMSMRSDFASSKLDQVMPTNRMPAMSFHPRLSQCAQYGICAEKMTSGVYKDSSAGPSLITQSAADEGSRTGMKGCGIKNIAASVTGAGERNSTSMMLSNQMASPQAIAFESSGLSSHQILPSVNRQMTIFYAGQAHVFDDVHPKKADAIMALAGSNGRSWSTTYSSRSSESASLSESCKLARNSNLGGKKVFSQDTQGKLPSPASAYSNGGQASSFPDPNIAPGVQGSTVKDAKELITAQAAGLENRGNKDGE
ncbi:TIFY 8 protein [Nymphaea thermarum]|nr:TIFY 8 protein [Nymphaea thermarum]